MIFPRSGAFLCGFARERAEPPLPREIDMRHGTGRRKVPTTTVEISHRWKIQRFADGGRGAGAHAPPGAKYTTLLGLSPTQRRSAAWHGGCCRGGQHSEEEFFIH